nr:EAL domain-containing protein [Bacilli bacterium]
AYLNRFPIDSLKIDKSFLPDFSKRQGDTTITDAVIALGHSLRLKVVAEGVETKEQLDFLQAQGCDEIQGYYLSKPIPEKEFIKFIHGVPENFH